MRESSVRVGKVQAWHSLVLVKMGDKARGCSLSQSTLTERDEAREFCILESE